MRRAISALALCLLLTGPVGAAAESARVMARSSGGDLTLARTVAGVLLAQTWPVQLTHVRCEAYAAQAFCGLILSGVKFHQRMDRASFLAEVDTLVRTTFAVDPRIAEVDLWVTVPHDAGEGATVSGDFALPTSATVYATSVPRRGAVGVFWDSTFARSLDRGANG